MILHTAFRSACKNHYPNTLQEKQSRLRSSFIQSPAWLSHHLAMKTDKLQCQLITNRVVQKRRVQQHKAWVCSEHLIYW